MSESNPLEGIEKLRKIVVWADFQVEELFSGLSMQKIIKLYEKCQEQGVDLIEHLDQEEN